MDPFLTRSRYGEKPLLGWTAAAAVGRLRAGTHVGLLLHNLSTSYADSYVRFVEMMASHEREF